MRNLLLLILLAVVVSACGRLPGAGTSGRTSASDEVLTRAIEHRENGLQVQGEGEVIKVLTDDHEGDRHQRFIVRLPSGQTLLIAHNIDKAPRVPSLQEGDSVAFSGEYEWNSRGGVIHWTHQDPSGRHPGGWLKHNGRVYQ